MASGVDVGKSRVAPPTQALRVRSVSLPVQP